MRLDRRPLLRHHPLDRPRAEAREHRDEVGRLQRLIVSIALVDQPTHLPTLLLRPFPRVVADPFVALHPLHEPRPRLHDGRIRVVRRLVQDDEPESWSGSGSGSGSSARRRRRRGEGRPRRSRRRPEHRDHRRRARGHLHDAPHAEAAGGGGVRSRGPKRLDVIAIAVAAAAEALSDASASSVSSRVAPGDGYRDVFEVLLVA
mmetsp:Transcript_14826/g.53327  ORF Transcript_14826/g.53327 Transcript_14826/m.53327 type:complete len:203 (-) Transcript_14826:326-934(-)